MTYNYQNRAEVPEKYRWNLKSRFLTDEDWTKSYQKVQKELDLFAKYKGKIFQNDNLYLLLEDYYRLSNEVIQLVHYASCKQDEDLNIPKYQKMYQEIMVLISNFEEKLAFMMPEILESSDFDIEKLIVKTPKLKKYRHVLEKFNLTKKYTKSEEIEKIITILTKDINNYEITASTLLNSNLDYGKIKDENGENVTLTTTNYGHFITSKNRDLRKKTYNNLNKVKSNFANIFGQNLLDFMAKHASIANIRGYNSTKEMDFQIDSVPISVHDTLKKQALKRIDLFQEYYCLKKDILGVKRLEAYDLRAPITSNEKTYTIEEAEDYVYSATKILGEDYSKYLKQGFKDRWIDYATYKGKRSGGYCCTTYPNNYNIFMSFNGNYDSISTMAHELGHAINSIYIYANNEVQYTGYDLYICEIASLLNEILLTNYVINNDFPISEKISVINEMLRTINGNFYTAIMENMLEDIVYQKLDNGESLSYIDLREIMDDLITKFYGNTVNKGEYMQDMWIARLHYFSPWYLYKYASCICCAVYFASKILNGDKETLAIYKEFLKRGTDKFSNDILLDLNLDLTKDKLYDELFAYYKSLLDQLKELTKVGIKNE